METVKKEKELEALNNMLSAIKEYFRLTKCSIELVRYGKFKLTHTGVAPLNYTGMNEFLRGYLFGIKNNI